MRRFELCSKNRKIFWSSRNADESSVHSTNPIAMVHARVLQRFILVHSVLLVDDSSSILALLENAFVESGYQVLVATNGREALRMLKVQEVDLIVTDIYMPETDGLELILALQRLPRRPVIIAMSSMSGGMDMLPMAKIFGAKKVLQKPFLPEDLLACANTLLSA